MSPMTIVRTNFFTRWDRIRFKQPVSSRPGTGQWDINKKGGKGKKRKKK